MSRHCLHPILLLSAAAAVSACAAGGEFPSLAPRAVEQAEAAEPTDPPPSEIAVDPALAERLATLLANARRGQTQYESVLPAASEAVAAAGAAGSEGWVLAQQAISRLEAERAPTVVALADLDQLAIAHAGAPELPAIIAARGETRALAEAQEQRIEALRGQLSPI